MIGDDSDECAGCKSEEDSNVGTDCMDGAFDIEIAKDEENGKVAKCSDISIGNKTRIERVS